MLKIKVDERGSREFYEEFYYVVANYAKIKKHPEKKAVSILKNNIVYFITTGLLIVILYLFYILESDYFCFTVATVLLFALVVYLRMDRTIRKAINELMSYKGTVEITMAKGKINYKDANKEINYGFDQVSSIVINKYSICIIPKQINLVLIAIPTDYKEEIVKFLEEEKLDDLLVDNSSKY